MSIRQEVKSSVDGVHFGSAENLNCFIRTKPKAARNKKLLDIKQCIKYLQFYKNP